SCSCLLLTRYFPPFPTRRSSDLRRPCSRREPMAIMTASASAHEIARAVSAGETSVTAVVDVALAAIKKHNPALNAFTAVTSTTRSEEQTSELQSPDHLVYRLLLE